MSTLWDHTKKSQDELDSLAPWELIEYINICHDEIERYQKIILRTKDPRVHMAVDYIECPATNEDKVRDFHEAMDQPAPLQPTYCLDPKLFELRINLINEEVQELVETEYHDIANVARELCDLLYVVYGTGIAFGIWLEPIFSIIHEANMQKVSGPVREDGKRMKPEGWQFPWEAVQKELERQRR